MRACRTFFALLLLCSVHFCIAQEAPPVPLGTAGTGLPAPVSATPANPQAPGEIRSQKRGLCATSLTAEDFKPLTSLTWWYNWGVKPKVDDPAKKLEHYPMVWGGHPAQAAALDEVLKAGLKPSFVLAINEPNMHSQANLPPADAAKLYAHVKALADTVGRKVVGPHMAIGTNKAESITAMDPFEKKDVTYNFMVPYLNAFYYFAKDSNCEYVAVHSYGNIYELKWVVGELHKQYNKPIWVTEFNEWKAPNDQAERAYLIQAVDFLEQSPYVMKYAWFMDRIKGGKFNLFGDPGKLTVLGETYVKMPVHDPAIHYAVPGRVEAEAFAASSGFSVKLTADADGFLETFPAKNDDWADYCFDIAEAGTYEMQCRVQGKDGVRFTLKSGTTLLAKIEAPGGDETWKTVTASFGLPAGKQTVRLQASGRKFSLNWFSFAKQ